MSKKTIYIISGFAGVIILACGAFFAMRMMSGRNVLVETVRIEQANSTGNVKVDSGNTVKVESNNNVKVDSDNTVKKDPDGGVVKASVSGIGADGKPESFSLAVVLAPEIPTQKPIVKGMVQSLMADTFIVATGNNVRISPGKDGEMDLQTDGPSTEVVITNGTKIYRDVTFDTHEPAADEKIYQVIEPLEAADIEKIDSASVWGSKRGDRLIAEFILITRPSWTNKPWVEY